MEWEEVHKVIGEMSEWERGWYHAFVMGLFFNGGDSSGAIVEVRVPLQGFMRNDNPLVITRYSRSGSQRHAESFYSPEPPDADDLITIEFDPVKFRATFMELDAEACIEQYRLITRRYESEWSKWVELVVQVATTESDFGIPEEWEDDPWPGIELCEVNAAQRRF